MPHKPTKPSSLQRRFVIGDDGTVYEARDHWQESMSSSSDSHRQKRKREDDESSDQEGGGSLAQDFSPFVRDRETYVDEATLNDVVVLVQKTLFKVPIGLFQVKSILDLGRGYVAGTYTDERPLSFELQVFSRDKEMVDKFRSLLWAFTLSTSDPIRFASVPQDLTDVDRILNVAKLAYEIELEDLYIWAQQKVITISQDDVYIEAASSTILRKLIEVGDLFNHPTKRAPPRSTRLSKSTSRNSLALPSIPPIFTTPCSVDIVSTVAHKWGLRIRHKRIPSAAAIPVSEEYGLAELKGIAYYMQIQHMGETQQSPRVPGGSFESEYPSANMGGSTSTEMMATQILTDPKLGKPQVLRLFAGYFGLVSFWERFRRTPLVLPMGRGCTPQEHHARCCVVWNGRWGSAIGWSRIMSYNSADALGLLACLKDQLGGDEQLREGVRFECREAGLGLLERKRRDLEANLASYFSGCI